MFGAEAATSMIKADSHYCVFRVRLRQTVALLRRDRKIPISALTQSTVESADRCGECEWALIGSAIISMNEPEFLGLSHVLTWPPRYCASFHRADGLVDACRVVVVVHPRRRADDVALILYRFEQSFFVKYFYWTSKHWLQIMFININIDMAFTRQDQQIINVTFLMNMDVFKQIEQSLLHTRVAEWS